MIKHILFLLTLLTTCTPGFATVLRSNTMGFVFLDLYFDSKLNASFLMTRHSVTAGQPFNHKEGDLLPFSYNTYHICSLGELDYDYMEITIQAGRHRSRQVFDDLVTWGFNTSSMPSEINFAVEGILTFTSANKTFTCEKIALSQTGLGLSNIWYVHTAREASAPFNRSRGITVSCTDQIGSKHTFHIARKDYSHNTFFIIGRQ